MSRPDLKDLLEEGLAQLRSGVGLDEVLAQHPTQAERLRPLLEAAWLAHSLDADISDMHIAQNRSRARFLGAARQRRERKSVSTRGRLTGMRLAGTVALIAIVLFASLIGTGLSSVSAVPGQALYPFKRAVEQAQMALTTRQSSRLELEEAFDQRRAQETSRLIETGRIQTVVFAGFLWKDPQLGWHVDRVPLILTPDQEMLASTLNGSYVEIKGVVRGDTGVEVSEMQLRLFHLDGVLEKMEPGVWKVSGVTVQIQDSTRVTGNLKPGMHVELTALRLKDGQFLALSAKPGGKGSMQPVIEPDDQRKPEIKKSETPRPALEETKDRLDSEDVRRTAEFLASSIPGDRDRDVTVDKDYYFSGSKKQ